MFTVMQPLAPSGFRGKVFHPPRRGDQDGFSFVELIVVVVILGVAVSLAIPSFLSVLRRERVNAIALEAAGWLEEARSQSAREVNREVLVTGADDSNQGGCAIVLAGPILNGKTGDIFATIDSSASGQCDVRQESLAIPDTQGDRFNIRVFGLGSGLAEGDEDNPCRPSMNMPCNNSVSLYFTPRGMWSSTSLEPGQGLEIRIAHADGRGPKRCVRMSSILGSIDIGRSSDGDLDATCETWGEI